MTLAAFSDWFDWFPSEAFGETMAWILVISMLVIGFAGTFLPVIPGPALIWIGALLHYFLLGMQSSGLSWQGLVVITILFGLAVLLDWLSGALGAKWFGSSRWGVAGALVGMVVGLFFSLPGLILGPIIGVFVFEMAFARKKVKEASNSTFGTVVGGIAGLFGRLILAAGMILWWAADVFMVN